MKKTHYFLQYLNSRITIRLITKLTVFVFVILLIGCQSEITDQDWPVYKSNNSSSSYSSLSQINKENVDQLEIAWTYRTNDIPEGDDPTMETNPIIVDGVLYGASPLIKIFAIDAQTGEEKWMFDPFEGDGGGGRARSMVYWQDGNDKRILFTAADNLYAIDAETGQPITEFGQDGKVSLNVGLGVDPESIYVRTSSPGIVFKDLLILGSQTGESYDAPPGHVRAYNIRTGTIEWTFRTIPHPGEFGYETWPKDAWQFVGGVNAWAGLSLDEERGLVFLPLGSPAYDFYGGHRKGKNLFGNSVVALDAQTGEYVWHYQIVHHDLWDSDLPAPPNLVTVEREGEQIDAVAQVTKMGFVFVLDRDTGEPLFPVEEREVPVSNVEGEEAWPTQPFPLKPEPFARQHFTVDEITNISQASHDSVLNRFNKLSHEGLYTPPSFEGTINLPSSRGGANWGGAAYDPESHVLFINGNESPEIATLKRVEQENDSNTGTSYARGRQYYMANCATCHGADRLGQHPTYPSVIDVANKLSKEEVLNIIKEGGSSGMMPAFASISEANANDVINYLFEEGKTVDEDSGEVNKDENNSNSTRIVNLTSYSRFTDPEGYPAIKPPWGTLNAINLDTGDYEWKIPLGRQPDLEKDGSEPLGTENWGGPIVTNGGLLFIGATQDKMFRAFDKNTGELLWETELPTGGFATPSTYMVDGKQYVVIAAGGDRGTPSGDYYIAFSLPDEP